MLGGPDLLAYLVLALGAAMAVGSVLALVRPPEVRREGDLERGYNAPLETLLSLGLRLRRI